MSKTQMLKALVGERLAAAAEEIFSAVELMMTEKRLHTSGMAQRAAVWKRLSVVADEISRMLEVMMSECEARASSSDADVENHRKPLDITLKTEPSSHRIDRLRLSGSDCDDVSSEQQKRGRSSSSSRVQKTSHLLQIKGVSTETESVLTHGKASHVHQTQRAERGTSTTMDTKAGGEQCVLPPSDRGVLSLKEFKAGSEDDDSDEELNERHLKSNRRQTVQRQSQAADCYETCGTFFHKGKKVERNSRKTAPTNNIETAGQSCCRVCGKFFRYKRSFLKHVLKHEQSSDLCGACGKHLDSDESLKVHLQTHNEENICGDQTDDRQADRSDAESKEGDSDEDWEDSEGSDSDDADSEKHETKGRSCLQRPLKTKNQGLNKTKEPKNKNYKDESHLKYFCKVCNKPFCYRASFLKHVQEDESDADLCGVCGIRFKSQESLRLHLQTYVRTNSCDVCGKHFDGHKQLEMHMRTHTGEKPYVCSVCGKAFAQNGNLMGHMRVHTGERPYVCSVCGQGFGFKEYMMAHMRIHTGEKPFLCSICGKGFRQRGTLKTHMMIHTGESTHQCSICDKKFYKSGALKIHMRSHTGEKPYLCNVCGKSFPASGSLTKHMGVHDGERPHCCGVCGKAFLRKENMKRHTLTHGNESTRLTSL